MGRSTRYGAEGAEHFTESRSPQRLREDHRGLINRLEKLDHRLTKELHPGGCMLGRKRLIEINDECPMTNDEGITKSK